MKNIYKIKDKKMGKTDKTFKVRDLRRKDKYTIDDEYLNGYAKLCGPFGTCAYNSLCRHASKDQECFPSIDLISEQHGIGRSSVLRGIKNLKEWGIILVIKEKDEKTKRQKNNVYILLDKSQWKPKPSITQTLGVDEPSVSQELGAESATDTDPSLPQTQSRVSDTDCKDTHVKDTHIKDIAAKAADPVICKIEKCGKEVEEGKEYCKLHLPMDLKEFLEWCAKSSQKHINIIGEWADTVKPEFRTQGQWTEYIKRYARAATALVPFDHDQLERGFEHIKKGIDGKWLTVYTLETLLKFVTNEKSK
jgi:DNA-binding transcriptional regulator GbsR (MarR family)